MPGEHPWSYVLDEPVRLLVADDDPILREFAIVHLSTPVAEVEVAADGLEAWSLLQSRPFDLALVDLDMPALDGYGLTERIRADRTLAHLPVVVVTGREDIRSIDRAYALGATSFVVKPVNWRQLSHQLRYVLRTSRAEAEAREARDRAEQASALKSTMFALLRHEFRTPLNAIIGFGEVIQRELHGPLPAAYRDAAAEINASGQNLLALLTETLNYAQLISGRPELSEDVYPVSELVEAAVSPLSALVGEGGPAPRIEVEPGLQLLCDRDEVVRLVGHLARNAATHGRSGALGIRAGLDGSGALVLSVTDEGCGMTETEIARCRAPFGQSEAVMTRRSAGLGLGLPAAIRIAELHGGTVEIESAPGRGTIVRARFPAARVSFGRVALPAAAAAA